MPTLAERILWRRARDYVRRYKPALIGVAGSSHTALVKDALALSLAPHHRLRVAPFRPRSLRGLALAILGAESPKLHASWLRLLVGSRLRELAEDEPDAIVLEVPSGRPGDVDAVARALPFQIAVITNTESVNLDLFGSREMVVHELASLVSVLPKSGTVCLNADDKLTATLADRTQARIIWFGESSSADVRLVRAHRLTQGYALEMRVLGRPLELHVPHIIARPQLLHLTAAFAVIAALEDDPRSTAGKLASLRPPAGSLRLFAGKNNSRLLDDSREVSPEGMLAALRTLAEIPAKRRLAILGDLTPLGARSPAWYESIGQEAARAASVLVTVGEQVRRSGAFALSAGGVDVHHFADSRDVGKWLADFLHAGDTVLISGSRPVRLEHAVERLLADPARDRDQLAKSSREE